MISNKQKGGRLNKKGWCKIVLRDGQNSVNPCSLSPHNEFAFINKYKWAYHGSLYKKKIIHSIEKFTIE